jgi:hypothetical protein
MNKTVLAKIIVTSFFLTAFFAAVFPCTQKIFAQSANSLVLSPLEITKNKGDTFPVTLTYTAPSGADVSGFDVTISYNSAVLDYSSLSPNADFDIDLKRKATPGRIQYARFNSTTKIINGTITLGTITFKGKAKGKTTVSVSGSITDYTRNGTTSVTPITAEYTINDPNSGAKPTNNTTTCNLCLGKTLCICSWIPF